MTNGFSKPINRLESGCYHSNQASVSGGVLHLRTAPSTGTDCRLRDGSVANIKSGTVSSNGKKEFRYGYFEARIRLDGAYNWPAFWTNGHHVSWPDRGELDVMELLSDRRPNWHAHFGSPDLNASGRGTSGVGWHTYGMRWTPTRVDFFYDGQAVGGAAVKIPYDHYLVLNHGVRADYRDGAVVNADMQVDYVRVWKLA